MSAILVPIGEHGYYLSPGDADTAAEKRIADWVTRIMPHTRGPRILKVAHHGSRTSDSPSFLTRLRPTEAWISVGTGNRYGHPAVEVLRDLEAHGIPVRRTDRDGGIRFIGKLGS